MRRIAGAATFACLATTLVLAPTGQAGPVCTGSVPTVACGDRVIADPLRTATFIQYGSEAFPALDAIEALAPDVVEVRSLAEWTGNPKFVSAGGRELPVVRITDESVRGKKKQVVISLSVHANEAAGREGGMRYAEDVARWWLADKTRKLYAGDVAIPLNQVLARTELWLGIMNADGWAAGDLGPGGTTFARGNATGSDLNREFPTIGWTKRSATPLSEPEAIGWTQFVRSLGPLATASDIHGELTSANNAFADLMWPAAQWTPRRQAQELQLGQHVIRTVQRKFVEKNVLVGRPAQQLGIMSPATAATGYDVVGYDDGGFMGDWLAQEGDAVEIDAENFLSHLAPGNVWLGALEEAHVAGVMGIIEAAWVEALITDQVRANLNLGRIAYVFDPRRVTDRDGGVDVEPGEKQKPYDVSRMRYFDDLRAATRTPVVAVSPYDIAEGRVDLRRFDSLVIADVVMPPDARGRKVSATKYLKALRTYANQGGQLLLTDAAVPYAVNFGLTGDDVIREALTNAGHIDFGDHSHPWERDLVATASQTYYEVPLGFPPTGSAPHYGISTEAWLAAKGVIAGTVNDGSGDFVGLGDMPYGRGKVSIFGALLPTPSEADAHVEGLVNYGVTIAGGQVFHRMLSYRRAP